MTTAAPAPARRHSLGPRQPRSAREQPPRQSQPGSASPRRLRHHHRQCHHHRQELSGRAPTAPLRGAARPLPHVPEPPAQRPGPDRQPLRDRRNGRAAFDLAGGALPELTIAADAGHAASLEPPAQVHQPSIPAWLQRSCKCESWKTRPSIAPSRPSGPAGLRVDGLTLSEAAALLARARMILGTSRAVRVFAPPERPRAAIDRGDSPAFKERHAPARPTEYSPGWSK